jgi:hypothetical protein
MFEIVRYTADKAEEWNKFVAESKNGTFLFDRHYMDYHSDRFEDYSLMFYRDGGLYALLPANREDNILWSHRGLTYGGIIMNAESTAARIQQLFRELNDYLRADGFIKVVYKPVPHIFHRIPSEEDIYSLFSVCDAKLIDRSISSTLILQYPLKWHRDRRYGINKAKAHDVTVDESQDLKGFWEVLTFNLRNKYDSCPVHSLEEIELLHDRFPQQIRLFTASKDGKVLGGTVLYITSTVVHTQYISANLEGKQWRVIDALFDYLLHECDWQQRYFDFGTSNEEDGRILVEPLIYQKEGFGGRGICYDWYEWTL